MNKNNIEYIDPAPPYKGCKLSHYKNIGIVRIKYPNGKITSSTYRKVIASIEAGQEIYHKPGRKIVINSPFKESTPCRNCGKGFNRYKSLNRIYCSPKCSRQFQARRSKFFVVCFVCEKDFQRQKSKIKEKNFCSQDCYLKYIRNETL